MKNSDTYEYKQLKEYFEYSILQYSTLSECMSKKIITYIPQTNTAQPWDRLLFYEHPVLITVQESGSRKDAESTCGN